MSYTPIRSEATLNHKNHSRYSTLPQNPLASSGRSNGKKVVLGANTKKGNSKNYPIIVHCHLCWDWVWQRPQQFISRLSQRHKILFVETVAPDPQLVTPLARFSKPEQFPNLTILRLQFPAWCWNEAEYVDRERR